MDWITRASARFSSRNHAIFLALISLLLYMASDFFSRAFLSNVGVAWIALFRFTCGLPLLLFTPVDAFRNRNVMIFAGANILNSICGVYAIIAGSLAGFALAAQLRPAFIIFFSVVCYHYRSTWQSWLYLLLLLIISSSLFINDTGFRQQANLIYIVSVAAQAAVFAGIGRNTAHNLTHFLTVYNVCGFVLIALFILLADTPWPDVSFLPLLIGNGLLAMLGSIFNIVSFASDYKVQVSSVSYLRLPLTLLLAGLLFNEELTVFISLCTAGILLLVFLLGRSSVTACR